MNVTYMVFQIISQNSKKPLSLTSQMSSGITSYVSDNGLDDILADIPPEKREYCLKMFLQPILSLPENQIGLYFETYSLRLAFKRTANKIHSAAAAKYFSSEWDSGSLPALIAEFNAIVKEIAQSPDLQQHLSKEISDCSVDLEYLSGASEAVSSELAHRIGQLG